MTRTVETSSAPSSDDPSGDSARRSSAPRRFLAAIRQLVETPAGTPWHRNPWVAMAFIVGSTLLTMLVGFLGPSVTTLTLGPRESLLPPWYLPGMLDPNPWLIAMLGYLIVLMGVAGTWIALRALARGWAPRVRNLYIVGVLLNLATITTPPQTSADSLMYAAYGRLAKLGFDPYEVSPAEVFRQFYDPVLRWTERPWQDTVEVYGPLLHLLQYAANVLGGDNLHDIVFWLQLFCCVGFIAACSVIVWIARGDATLQRRAILWTLASPAMIWAVVTGAHNEGISIFFAMAGLLMIRRYPFLTGLLIGVACTGKATVGIYGLAMAWAYRRQLKALLLSLLGAAIPNVIVYIFLYPKALELASKNASYVAGSSWIHPVRRLLEPFLDGEVVASIVSVLSWGSAVLLCWMLSRVLPWRALPGAPKGVSPERDPLAVAMRTSVWLAAGWVMTSSYSLAWYDLIYFLPMALLGATRLDAIGLIRVTVLNLAYVLGRVIAYPPVMSAANQRLREIFSTSAAIGVIVLVVLWWHEHGLKVGSHLRSPRSTDSARPPIPSDT